jgi:hypothetical protein
MMQIELQVEIVTFFEDLLLLLKFANILAVLQELTDIDAISLIDVHPNFVNFEMDLKQIKLLIGKFLITVFSIINRFGELI